MIKLFECIVGSQSYGTNIETSDTDIKGVYIQTNEDILGLKYKEQVNIDKDTVYYELRRFVDLLGSANPTVLEMLFTDDKFVVYEHPAFKILRDNRKKFLTRNCRNSFGGMAVAQIVKSKSTSKKMNWEDSKIIRRTPLDFCTIYCEGKVLDLSDFLTSNNMKQDYCGVVNLDRMKDCYCLYYGEGFNYRGICFEESNHIRLSSIPRGEKAIGMFLYNQDAYTKHCREYKEYQEWLNNRNVNRFVETQNHNQKIDGKNLMHCVRLIDCAKEIALTGDFKVYRDNREELLSIRRGNVELQNLIDRCESEIKNLDNLYNASNLPTEIKLEEKHDLILQVRRVYWNSVVSSSCG